MNKFIFCDGSEVNYWLDKNGYFICKIKGKNTKVHRRQFLLSRGFLTPGLTINHIDGDKENNSPENLEEMTFSENAKHSWKNGLARPNKGSAHGRAILDEMKVLAILTMPKKKKNGRGDGWGNKQLADIFGVSEARISNIRAGKEWLSVYAAIRD